MRQLRSTHVVLSLFLLTGSIYSSENNLCQCGDSQFGGRNVDANASVSDQPKRIMTAPDPNTPVQPLSQEIPTFPGDDLPVGGVSSGGYQPSLRGSSTGKDARSATGGANTSDSNVPPLPTPKQPGGAPSAPGGLSDSQTQSNPAAKGSANGSPDPSLSSNLPSSNNRTASQAPSGSTTARLSGPDQARLNGSGNFSGPLSNLTSNTLPTNSSSIPPKETSNPPVSAGKSQSKIGKPTDDQKTAIIVSSVLLGVLVILGVILATMRRNEKKREELERQEEGNLQARPGELGKRGTVMVGRGLESSHGLPSSGGWLDNRSSELGTTRTLSVSSSTSADSNEAELNPA